MGKIEDIVAVFSDTKIDCAIDLTNSKLSINLEGQDDYKKLKAELLNYKIQEKILKNGVKIRLISGEMPIKDAEGKIISEIKEIILKMIIIKEVKDKKLISFNSGYVKNHPGDIELIYNAIIDFVIFK